MYKIPEGTLFTGKSLIYVPECQSTNDIAAQMLQQPSIHEGSVIITDRQLKGRGQRGAVWLSEHGQNLTMSVVFKPTFLTPQDQFYLNVVVSLAVRAVLASYCSEVFVKWPNDVLIHDKKVAGILIENQIKGNVLANSVAGIGLNVNQQSFPLDTAASLATLTGQAHTIQTVLEFLLSSLERYYLQLKGGNRSALWQEYLQVLYWRDEDHTFSDRNGTFEGRITGVDSLGRLHISAGGHERYFAVKEVEYIR